MSISRLWPTIVSFSCSFLTDTFGQTDGTGRTDEAAEVTADTLSAYQTGTAGLVIEDNGLMAAIATRHLTAPTADT